LSGRTHEVLTGTAFVYKAEGVRESTVCRSKVTFLKLSGSDIDEYLATGEYKDKAGAYAIQGHGNALIDKYEGSYSNIVGLPVGELIRFFMLFNMDRLPWKGF